LSHSSKIEFKNNFFNLKHIYSVSASIYLCEVLGTWRGSESQVPSKIFKSQNILLLELRVAVRLGVWGLLKCPRKIYKNGFISCILVHFSSSFTIKNWAIFCIFKILKKNYSSGKISIHIPGIFLCFSFQRTPIAIENDC
jgi:hypothetical protein